MFGWEEKRASASYYNLLSGVCKEVNMLIVAAMYVPLYHWAPRKLVFVFNYSVLFIVEQASVNYNQYYQMQLKLSWQVY